jgi:uncharacterized protein
MSQTLNLYRLQQIDSQIDRARSRLQTIQNNLENNSELRLALERTNSSNAHLLSVNETLILSENAVQDQRIKIEQIESSLYTGKGHSPKELLDLQNDAAALKRNLVILEDKQLEAMQLLEEANASYLDSQSELQSIQDRTNIQNHDLQKEKDQILKEMDTLLAEREAVAGPLPPSAHQLYDNLRQERRGLAVAVISDNSCAACGAGLSLGQIQSARASEEVWLCPSCGRILYGS